MKPTFHPQLVNPPFEDPVLYVDFLFRKQALLFDLGEVLVQHYETDFTVLATEVDAGHLTSARFRCRAGFAAEPLGQAPAGPEGTLLDQDGFRVRAAILDHRIPCLAFSLEEHQHVNVWKNRLEAMGLPTGTWLQTLKSAVARGEPDDTSIRAHWRSAGCPHERRFRLGELRHLVGITRASRHGSRVARPTGRGDRRFTSEPRAAV